MKPASIVALVLAGAVGGAVLMKVVQRPGPVAQPPAAAIEKAAPQVAPAPATPPAQTEAQATPAAPVEPVEKPQPEAPAPKPKPAVTRVRRVPPPANPRPLVVAKVEPHEIEPPTPQPPSEPAAPAQVQAVSENPTPQAPPATLQPENVTPPAQPQPSPPTVTLNTGLEIPVRLVDGLSSERNLPGDTFIATLDHELVVDGFVIAEKGARVEGRVVNADKGTKVNAGATLVVELTRLHTSDRQIVPIETEPFEKRVDASRGQDLGKVGAGAAIGAIIGALAGGGKGAAIGAGAGGGAGAGAVLLTRKPAALPSETRITFRLRTSVTLTERVGE